MAGVPRSAPDCPSCKAGILATKDSRPTDRPEVIRRRRKCCSNCGYACTTHEVIVHDTEGFANAQIRMVREFMFGVEKLAREKFGNSKGRLEPEGKSK